jgi:hypothetical protein
MMGIHWKETAMETLLSGESGTAAAFPESYKIAVTEVPARLALVSGAKMPASFFLASAGEDTEEHEGLLAHLNNERKQFIAIRGEAGISLVCADAIAYVCVGEPAPEVDLCDVVGAPHHAAQVRLCTGEELRGDFVCLTPSERARLSDLINEPGQRFLLFTRGTSTYLIHRNAVQQVSPL